VKSYLHLLPGCILIELTVHVLSPAQAQPTAAQIDLKDIAAVCSGLQTAHVSGGAGTIRTDSGYEFQVTPDKELKVIQSGQLVSKIDRFAYQDYTKCVSDLAVALTRPLQANRECRRPINGVEFFQREFDVTRESGWRGGGFSQGRWCDELISTLRAEHTAQGSTFTATNSSEVSESKCRPFNCPQYNYTCKVHVRTDPIYFDKPLPECR
jgi:hypothetical protein